MSYGAAAVRGGMWGARLGALLGPLGGVVGGLAGAAVAVGGAYLANEVLQSQMNKADKEAEEQLGEGTEAGDCEDCATQEEQEERQRELEEEAGVEQQTKGKTKHGELDGGMDRADDDFDSLQPDDVRNIETQYGPGRTGTLENGSSVTVRPGSSDGRPTLQIRRPNGRQTEIRYNGAGT